MSKTTLLEGLITLITKAETTLPKDVINSLKNAKDKETNPLAQLQLQTILKNIDIAQEKQRPLCQDTGVQTFFITCGYDFPHPGRLKPLLTQAVITATKTLPLRPNTVDAFTHHTDTTNTGDYIPAITWDFIPGDTATITAIPKGGGSENMSKLVMLKPTQGIQGIKDFVLSEMTQAGGNPCPPTIIGLGIGGGADLAMKLGKLALLRPLGTPHTDPETAQLEQSILQALNNTNIGPMGLGGNTTTLAVHIEKAPRHPASLPVGLTVQCWAHRKATMTIQPDLTWEVH